MKPLPAALSIVFAFLLGLTCRDILGLSTAPDAPVLSPDTAAPPSQTAQSAQPGAAARPAPDAPLSRTPHRPLRARDDTPRLR